MSNEQPLASASGARRWYGRLIDLYPGAFRERYAAEMLRVFDESWSRVSNQGVIARWRYWLHVIRDFLRTLPGEWLAAMPVPTKVGLFAVGAAVSLSVICHQWLFLAYWLFISASTIACGLLIHTGFFGFTLSLLLASVWTLTGTPGFIHAPSAGGVSGAVMFSVSVVVAIWAGLLGERILRKRDSRWAAGQNQPSGTKITLSHRVLGVLSVLFMVAAALVQLQIMSNNDAAWNQFIIPYLFFTSCLGVTRQLSVIWREPGKPSLQHE